MLPGSSNLPQPFWPGALTLVLPAREELPRVLLGGRDTVAVRMPDHPFALDLIQRLGGCHGCYQCQYLGAAGTTEC